MRDEIRKVLAMNKAGQIDDDQAAELLAALNDKQEPAAKTTVPEFNLNNLGDMISGLVNSALNKSISVGGAKIKIRSSDNEENVITGSNVENPRGEDFDFTDNKINLSTLSGLDFSHSANLSDNTIQASTIKNLTMSHGELTDSQINGSSIEDVEIDASEWADQSINGCKFQKMKLSNNTELTDMQWHGCNFKNVTMEKVEIRDVQMNGTNANHLTMKSCEWSDIAVSGCQFNGCEFENVKMNDGRFEGVRFVNCKISDVDISDFALSKLDFTGETITGIADLEQFIERHRGSV